MRLLWACALFLAACEDDALYRAPDPPDLGFVDLGVQDPPDAGFVDVGFPDAGFPDAEEPPPAPEPIYVHTGSTLFSYDPETNRTTRIGDFRSSTGLLANDVVDIAIDLDGRMFGGTRQPGNETDNNEIYQIDPTTGLCRFRFHFDDTLHGLTFLPDGRLVIAGEHVSVVDPNSGRKLLEFPAAEAYETSGDIVGLPDAQLYWTVRGERDAQGRYGSDRVVRIDPVSGQVRVIGDAQIDRIYGLGYANDQLFGFSSAGKVVVLNPNSGAMIRQNDLAGRWFGATTNPVLW